MAKCITCEHYSKGYICGTCHDMDKYEEIGMDNKVNKSTNKDVDEIIRDYEILINKYEEAFELYEKTIEAYKEHIELLKEKVRLLEKLNNLHTNHIEELKKYI